jgi:hypothetical protein
VRLGITRAVSPEHEISMPVIGGAVCLFVCFRKDGGKEEGNRWGRKKVFFFFFFLSFLNFKFLLLMGVNVDMDGGYIYV